VTPDAVFEAQAVIDKRLMSGILPDGPVVGS
jgi:hypothetical protein